MAPLSNTLQLQFVEMSLEVQPRNVMDMFLLCSSLCFPISLTNRRAVGTVSSKEMLRNGGTDPLYCQSSIYSRMFSNLTCVDFFLVNFFYFFLFFYSTTVIKNE